MSGSEIVKDRKITISTFLIVIMKDSSQILPRPGSDTLPGITLHHTQRRSSERLQFGCVFNKFQSIIRKLAESHTVHNYEHLDLIAPSEIQVSLGLSFR